MVYCAFSCRGNGENPPAIEESNFYESMRFDTVGIQYFQK